MSQGSESAGDRASRRAERVAGCKISGIGSMIAVTYAGLSQGEIYAHREVRPAHPSCLGI